MTYFELILTAIGLGMDAFAISLCRALGQGRSKAVKSGYTTALVFGLFQALMTTAGYFTGLKFLPYILETDHWIAFFILSFIGGRMIYSALFSDEDPGGEGMLELLLVGAAVSIDALMAGMSLPILDADILFASSVIGTITFILCLFAVFMSRSFNAYSGYKAELAGGIILILTALKLLLSHMGIINV